MTAPRRRPRTGASHWARLIYTWLCNYLASFNPASLYATQRIRGCHEFFMQKSNENQWTANQHRQELDSSSSQRGVWSVAWGAETLQEIMANTAATLLPDLTCLPPWNVGRMHKSCRTEFDFSSYLEIRNVGFRESYRSSSPFRRLIVCGVGAPEESALLLTNMTAPQHHHK